MAALSAGILAFVLRLYLIHRYPEIFGGDSVVRLANHDRVFLAHQLPALQALIAALTTWTDGVLPVRYALAGIAMASASGFFLVAQRLMASSRAWAAAAFFALSPFAAAFSIVPYQEILMLAGLFWALYFFWSGRTIAASAALGLACLTRYEAWIACPIFLGYYAAERGWRAPSLLRGAALFGWAPLAWVAAHGGLTPEGTYAVEADFTIERLYRWLYLGWIFVSNTPPPVLVFAVWGVWRTVRQGFWRCSRFQLLMAYGALFLLAILFSAHGERQQPQRFVSAREAHVLLAGGCLLAGLGLPGPLRYRWAVVGLGLAWSTVQADRFVARETSQPHVRLSYQAAKWMDHAVAPGEQVVVLARPIPEEAVRRYVEAARKRGGDPLEVLGRMRTGPPDYQRILVQTRSGPDRIRSLASLPLIDAPPPPKAHPDWILRWSDFQPSNEQEARWEQALQDQRPERTFAHGGVELAVFRWPRPPRRESGSPATPGFPRANPLR